MMRLRIGASVTAITLISLALAGCELRSSDGAGDIRSDAYILGYEGNLGLSPANKGNLGGNAIVYCESMTAIHPDLTPDESSDFIRGCVDAWNSGY